MPALGALFCFTCTQLSRQWRVAFCSARARLRKSLQSERGKRRHVTLRNKISYNQGYTYYNRFWDCNRELIPFWPCALTIIVCSTLFESSHVCSNMSHSFHFIGCCSMSQMRRIDDAIAYFQKWPSLKSQEPAIRGLEDLSNTAAKECIDEFNRLMRTVGPAVQFQV